MRARSDTLHWGKYPVFNVGESSRSSGVAQLMTTIPKYGVCHPRKGGPECLDAAVWDEIVTRLTTTIPKLVQLRRRVCVLATTGTDLIAKVSRQNSWIGGYVRTTSHAGIVDMSLDGYS